MSLLPIHLGISIALFPTGVNICPKNLKLSICCILKMSVQLNQKIVKVPIKIFKQSQNGGIGFQAKLKNNINSGSHIWT